MHRADLLTTCDQPRLEPASCRIFSAKSLRNDGIGAVGGQTVRHRIQSLGSIGAMSTLTCLRVVISKVVDFVGWTNSFYLRNAIARERGIAAYRAWMPFERIRPVSIPQQKMGRDICLAG
jgi:hypothetical protein